MRGKLYVWGLIVIFLLSILSFAQTKEFKYVGAIKCKTCHNTAKNGEQFKIWQNSNHAKAYESLKSEEAKKKAKAMGVADPLTSDKCLSCHSTAFGKKNIDAGFSAAEGVSCEACHGPGSEYKQMSTMKDRKLATAAGMWLPDEKTCQSCHKKDTAGHQNKFTTYAKEYDKIKHPVPADSDRRVKKS
jgi:hypothetical protein